MSAAYDRGLIFGRYKRDNPEYDARWDFADAAKAGTFAEFKRGFEDGMDSPDKG